MKSKSLALLGSVALGALATAGVTACGSPPVNRPPKTPTDLAGSMHAYVDDAAVGRRALEDSIVNRDNAYSVLRLARYDARHWGRAHRYGLTLDAKDRAALLEYLRGL